MASHFRIQKPYELASLPRSLDQTGDSYVVGEVFGQSHGKNSRKRKRAELAVGIDGEALNLYDIASSKLITSYPVPPQASFTCPPCSLRWKSSDKSITRYTYTSTLEPKPKLVLHKDAVGASGASASTSITHDLPRSHRIVHLASAIPRASADASQVDLRVRYPSLIAISKSGAITCFDGESLQQQWQSSPETLKQDTSLPTSSDVCIDFAQTIPLADVVRGVFGGRDDIPRIFSLKVEESNDNQDVLVLVSSSSAEGKKSRHIHVVAILPTSEKQTPKSHGVAQIFVAPLPARPSDSEASSIYRMDILSGSFSELQNDVVTMYDLSSAVPKIESEIHVVGATSFLRLSKSSVLTATITDLTIYNPLYRSLQTSVSLELAPRSRGAFKFVSYFSRLEMAVATWGASLVAVQLEAPKSRSRKRQAEGLLIDSIGRGIASRTIKKALPVRTFESSTFSTFTPPSLEDTYGPGSWAEDAKKAEALMKSGQFSEFEQFMARSFRVECTGGSKDDTPHVTNGTKCANGTDSLDPSTSGSVVAEPQRTARDNGQAYWVVNGLEIPVWKFTAELAPADRRLVIYAIRMAFTTVNGRVSNLLGWKLRCRLPWSGVLQYLTLAGHLSIPNLRTALELEHPEIDGGEDALGEQLPQVLAEVDPTLELLLTWLSTTKLGPVELFSVVKIIMQSLELIQDPKRMTKNLLPYPPTTGTDIGAEENGEIGMELDRLEEELQLTEHYLEDSSNRAQGLSIAFSKLGGCPAVSNIRAIRQVFKPEETLSLMYLLRIELNRDGWTSRYLDGTRQAVPVTAAEEEDAESAPDSSIRLITDLLCQCIDSVGPGGWLINDILSLAATPPSDHLDSADFLNSMKLEVSAALEGVEEAVYLRGLLAEVVKYGAAASAASAAHSQKGNHPLKALTARVGVVTTSTSITTSMLPLGSKPTKHTVSKKKIVSGGEIRDRTSREIGHLTSKKVADYSLERIVI